MRKRWQYTHVLIDDICADDGDMKELNRLGSEGWELVAIVPDHERYEAVAYFKREADL